MLSEVELTHARLVRSVAKPGMDIINSLNPETAHLLHMGVGVAGEAGELMDAIKKVAIYCKPVDLENVIEELGDLEFYMEGIRDALNITREECLTTNVLKLTKRYGSGRYSNTAAQERADKTSPEGDKQDTLQTQQS